MRARWHADVVEPNIRVVDGQLLTPEGPGLGTRLRDDVFDRADVTVESSDKPGAPHWGGHESPVFEIVGERGERKIQYRMSWDR